MYHCQHPSKAHSYPTTAAHLYLWIFEGDFRVIQMWKCSNKYCIICEKINIWESVYLSLFQSSIFCSITFLCVFFFFLGLTSSGVKVTVSAPSTVDFLCFGIGLPAEEGSGSARPILDLTWIKYLLFLSPMGKLQIFMVKSINHLVRMVSIGYGQRL